MKDDRLYLVHMLTCMERLAAYTRAGRAAFMADTKTQDAVIRNLEVMGEAAKRISQPVRDMAPEIPWRQVCGMRDVLIHQYQSVDLNAVWLVVDRELPRLEASVKRLLETIDQAQ